MTQKKFSFISSEAFINNYPNFKSCSIQLFDDNPKKKRTNLSRIYTNEKAYSWEVRKLNNEWAWVFFSVNSMVKWKRNKKSVIWVNAWIVEVDDVGKEEQYKNYLSESIKPSAIIESKKSLHAYYFANDGTIDNWVDICMGLQQKFGGDIKVAKDISRVLRLPGYYHQKDEKDKFFVTCIYLDPKYYTESDMLKVFPYIREEIQHPVVSKSNESYEKIRDLISKWDSMEMLKEFNWTSYVNHEIFDFTNNTNWTFQIWVN